ncbi:MAG: 2-oxo acid dehydrogenase subunit E2 [Planctomycetes bacterium]|nr:2-oxo acid dehydrogenase subunit E2 [Planctomycetota bacterium]
MDFKLPDIGEGIHEGEVVKWLVKEGDVVKEDQPIVQVMTDKATVEIPSPRPGRIAKIHAPEGKTALVGSVLVTIDDGSSAAAAPAQATPAAPRAVPAAAAPTGVQPHAPANGPAAGGVPRVGPGEITREVVRAAVAAQAAVAQPQPGARKVNGKVLAAPATRKLAREMGLQIDRVLGTGPNGRVTKDDLQKFASPHAERPAPAGAVSGEVPSPAPLVSSAQDERVPLRGLRKIIAEAMHRSKSTAAHFTYVEEVDVTDLVAFRTSAKAVAEQRGVRLTYLPFIIKAIVAALKQYPYVNASLDDAAGEILLRKSYHIGVATATDDGLMVPVVRDCDKKPILQIARELDDLANRTRAKRATRDELRGSTFTITSLGSLGGLFATPVINYPEVAIMGVHKIMKRPWVVKDQIVIRDIMLLSLSLDHRVVDGAVGAQFMNRVVEILQDPKLLLLE